MFGGGSHERGPYSPKELMQLAKSGELTHSTLVRTTMKPEWRPAGTVKGLFNAPLQKQPTQPPVSLIPSDLHGEALQENLDADDPKSLSGIVIELDTESDELPLLAQIVALLRA